VRIDEHVPHGACVRIEGEAAVGGIMARKTEVLRGEDAEAVYRRVRVGIERAAELPPGPLHDDRISQALWPRIREAALSLICARKLGRSVLLRFHGDADGICGAFAVTSVVQCKAFQQNSAIYGVREALRDISIVGQESRPIVILLDFGSSAGCKEGIGLLDAAGIELMIIDHHPSGIEDKRMINPVLIEEGASKYTAGYIGCEIAAAAGMDREKALSLARTACSGDKSDLLGSGEEDARKALVLDFLASHLSFGNNLDFYRKVVESDELFASIAQQADESIEEAAGKAIARSKRSAAKGCGLCVFPLEGIAKRGEWPPAGKITTRVFDKINEAGPLICIGYTERSIIMRLNDAAVGAGFSANGLAERMKKSMADFVEGGGGHARAGAIRAREGFVKEIVNQLVREIGGMV
jgi:RecJ-like exonuclease